MAESVFHATSGGLQDETNLYRNDPVEKAVWATVMYLSFNPGSIQGGLPCTPARHTVQDYLHQYYPGLATQEEIQGWTAVRDGNGSVYWGGVTTTEMAQQLLTANVTRIHPVPDYRP